MNWSAIVPAFIALCGVPLTYLLTVKREIRTRRELWKHEEESIERQQQIWVQQQWWHEKAKTYSGLVEVLYEIKTEADASLEEMWRMLQGGVSSTEKTKESNWKENLEHLRRVAQIGAFTVSEQATLIISDYLKTQEALVRAWNDDSKDMIDIYTEDVTAADECLGKLRQAALEDLGVRISKKDQD